MGLPSIEIIFKQLAVTAVKRSQLGIVGLIVNEVGKNWTMKEYKSIIDVKDDDYTAEVLPLVKDTFEYTPNKVFVFNKGAGTLADTLKLVEQERINWIGLAYDGASGDTATLVSWIKSVRKAGKTYKAVVFKATKPDNKGIVNLMNDKVTFVDARGEVDGWQYVPTILGMLAGLPMTRSATSFLCGNLKEVSIFNKINETIDKGGFCLYKDEGDIRVARGCTSLEEITQDETEDMKDIIIVESMDLMRDDIYSTFKKWIGKYKNKYDNQVLFFTAINAYFKELEREDILDKEYDNYSQVDVEAQRLAWLGVGKKEVEDYDDEKIKKLTFKKKVFMKANIKILNAVEDFKFTINMF
jgi:phage tail sheath protein|nr:MAG TPA: tail protein [Caudoviricetes sp.]DAO37290.1 MAG TPA: tail protein [Caudoviricetes sp.]